MLTKVFHLIVPAVLGLGGASSALGDPATPPSLTITLDVARALIDRPAEDPSAGLNDVRLRTGEPGFMFAKYRLPHEFQAAKMVARDLHRRFELTLVLVPLVRGIDVPGFDGLVLDRDGRVIANFAIGATGTHGLVPGVFANKFDRTHRYGVPETWGNRVFAAARIIAGLDHRVPIDEVVLTQPDQIARFQAYVEAYRLQRAIFGVGTGRPTWMLINAVRWNVRWQDHFKNLVPAGSLINRVYLLHGRKIHDLTPTCVGELA